MTLKHASREVRLQWFARHVIDAVWQGQLDDDDVIRRALEADLLVEQEATEDDVEKYDLDIEPGGTFCKFSSDLDAENVDWKQLLDDRAALSDSEGR